ncbi:MAG: T9SS type A sorting domain-containing protein [Flavobacteriales bacterium]
MKGILLVLSLIFAASLAGAQITITQNDMGVAGDSMVVGNFDPTTTMPVGGTGAQSWNYTFLVEEYNILKFVDPVTTNSASHFQNADLAIERFNDTLFFKSSAAKFELDGLAGSLTEVLGVPISMALNIPDDVSQIEFPATHLDVFNDNAVIDTTISCAALGQGSVCYQARVVRRIYVNSSIDAYGSLETSGGSYPNTLRQYYKERTLDSIWVKILPIAPMSFVDEIDTTIYHYRWYANGEKWPVLSATADAQGGNIVTTEFQIDKLLASIEQINVPSCNGGCNGSATVLGLGADPPYSYTWPASANNQSGATATGLCAGTYMVTVNDNDTDSYELEVIIVEPAAMSITGAVQNATDAGGDGKIDITVGGGVAPYVYSWIGPNGFTSTAADPIGLDSGEYIVTAMDINGCSIMDTFTIGVAVGVNELNREAFTLFPNPASQKINVTGIEQIKSVIVYDLIGNKVVTLNPRQSTVDIDVTGLSNGTYMVEVISGNDKSYRKVTVNH